MMTHSRTGRKNCLSLRPERRATDCGAEAGATTSVGAVAQGCVASFRRADPAMLAGRELLRRTDTKFALPTPLVPQLLRTLQPDYRVLEAAGNRLARYETLYYDTPDSRCFNDHRRGRSPRHKIRVRHYLDRRLTFLEIKCGGKWRKTHKFRKQRTFRDSELSATDLDFIRTHTGLDVSRLEPQLWTNFSRLTLLAEHEAERVTMDTALAFVGAAGETQVGSCALVEVKQPRLTQQSTVMRALRRLRIRPLSVSKFCVGVVLTDADTRPGRFIPVLKRTGLA